MKKLIYLLFSGVIVSAAVTGCNNEESYVVPSPDEANIYEMLQSYDEDIEYTSYSEETGEMAGRGSWKRRGKGDSKRMRATFKTLTTALSETDLMSTVVRANITVFAPTDEAFAKLGLNPDNISSVPNLAEILLYHVLGNKVYSTDLSYGCVETVSGAEVSVNLTDGVFINSSQVIKADVEAFNGVFHIVDNVLLPPDKNLAEIAIGNPEFSILVEAVSRVGLVDALTGDSDLTVFAPTNEAFLALLEELGAGSLDDIDDATLTSVLLYHVVGGKVCSNALSDGQRVTTLNGGSFTVDLNSLSLTDANGRSAGLVPSLLNLQATNGVIHVIDKVILPPLSNIVEIAAGNVNFTMLVQAVTRVGLQDALSTPGPFTVFAPTNDAFVALLSELGANSLDDIDDATLTQVLLYHVVEGRVYSGDLSDGLSAATLNGDAITFDLSGAPSIIDANGRSAGLITSLLDIQASNGVVHVIDTVILPGL